MLALCTRAAWDAYNYANHVESHKALFKPENPPPPTRLPPPYSLLFSTLWLWRKPTVLDGSEGGLVQQACICNKKTRREGRQAGEIFQKWEQDEMEALWQGCVCSISPCVSMYSSTYSTEWSVKPLSWLITDCLHCGQVSTQLRALQRVGAVIIRCKWCVHKHPYLWHFFLFYPIEEIQGNPRTKTG